MRLLITLFLCLAVTGILSAQNATQYGPKLVDSNGNPTTLKDAVRFDQNYPDSKDPSKGKIPLDVPFTDENGKTVTLREYYKDKPVIIVMVYYGCPSLCTQTMTGLSRALLQVPLKAGVDYHVVTVSIDPTETPQLAMEKKKKYVSTFPYPEAENGWHLLTGEESSIKPLAEAVGFYYAYDVENKVYAHPAGIVLTTPSGDISRYFFGIDYRTSDMRFGLIDASQGKIGTPVDKFVLYCFKYDPTVSRYGLAIVRIVQIASALFALVIGTLIFVNIRKDKRKDKSAVIETDKTQQ